MIITLTLNPAIDKMLTVDDFQLDKVNRAKDVRRDIGGKGINVSKVVAELGGKTTALGLLAGNNGNFIVNRLDELGIIHNFTWLDGETRTNLKLVDIQKSHEIEINEPGFRVTDSDIDNLKSDLLDTVTEDDFVVLSGSLPRNVPSNIYADLITDIKNSGGKAVLDTSGFPLTVGLKAKPYLIKPNLSELEELVNEELETLDQIVRAGKKVYHQGIKVVIISLGSEGSIIISNQGVWKLTSSAVEVKSTVGAGDTLVGALVLQLNQGVKLKQAITYAAAASVNSVTKPGTQLCQQTEVEQFLELINVEELE
ncbi:1-phosphofructokinase [Sporohalobacter salinus]|uniref:1-phosphofructokinase n=1 Tax=Sporohalobacter salinus TaxID=1494606 RepID=UPI0019610767|nr:1-phosphofructokinase [Sporohalobacter salinus]MBM7624169.1 1-phosphofructokinase [Sporohalobacter salinus]